MGTRSVVNLGLQRKSATIVVAVLAIYAVDFSINAGTGIPQGARRPQLLTLSAVQASCRSLIVDTLRISQQQHGSAWATRMSSIGHLVGYFIGTLDMVGIFGNFLGDTQFKKMTVISALGLIVAIAVTCWAVTERILISPA